MTLHDGTRHRGSSCCTPTARLGSCRARTAGAMVLLAAVLGFSGCCKGSKDSGSSPATAGSSGPGKPAPPAPAPAISIVAPPKGVFAPGEADKILPKGGAPIIRLLDAGAEPRAPLRYALTPGTVSADATVDVSTKAAVMSMSLPHMAMTYEYAVAASQGGRWPVVATLKSVKVEGGSGPAAQLAGLLRTKLKALEGLTLSYQLDDRGRVSDMKSSLGDRHSPEIDEIIRVMDASQQAMTLGLPDEPIGKGGKWQIVTRSPDSGMDLLQEVVCTLTNRSGSAVTVDMAIRQFAASDKLGFGSNATTVRSFTSNATMHTDGELTAVVPRSTTMRQEYSYNAGQGDVSAVNKVGITRR
jgi:hypothetical protein